MLSGRTIVLGVSGGIAAYKAIEVCRRLVDAGAHVVPVMTAGATRFVGEVTFSALASEPVQTSLWSERDPIPHTRLGQRADLVLVCPATARLIGAYAAGISDDLLTATLLATRAPVVVCPAMHTEMWEHPAVQDNLATLRRRGVRGRRARPRVAWPAATSGAGRLADAGRHRGRRRGGARPGRRPPPTSTACACWSPPAGPASHRPGPLHRQPFVGQAGLRPGRRAPGPRGQGHPGHHRVAPGAARDRGGRGGLGGRDGGRRPASPPTPT